ncbi:hypothetical protein J3459_016013 [Metarhizium acridum]|nr:hypothetical protein J3459_016013 [Metarhizium acridum]
MGYQGIPKMPILLYEGVSDQVGVVKDTDGTYEYYCARGASIQYVRDAVAGNGIAAATPASKAPSFLIQVLNGRKQPEACSKKTLASSLLDPATARILPPYILQALLDLIGNPI